MATLQLFGSAEQCEAARGMIEEAVENREQKQKQRQKEYEKKKDVSCFLFSCSFCPILRPSCPLLLCGRKGSLLRMQRAVGRTVVSISLAVSVMATRPLCTMPLQAWLLQAWAGISW